MITNPTEILNIVITILIIGFIFIDAVPGRKIANLMYGINWNDYMFALSISAPAIILHEMAHKFSAIFVGVDAFYQISTFGLMLGFILKIFNAPFIILAPGYVQIQQSISPFMHSLIAVAGPLTNLLIFGIAAYMVKHVNHRNMKTFYFWAITKRINLWLFIFNMLPIPPFDGFQFLAGLYYTLF